MPRTARVVVAGAPHHVFLRGNNRRRLFSNVDDRREWLACLRLGLDASRCQLHQLTLMTNHVHLIATPPEGDALSRLVKRTCQRYAQRRNASRDCSGKLFEERFHSKAIVDDAHLMTTTLYNDANAFRAGLVTGPLEHRWSTGPLHAGRADGPIGPALWTPSGWYRRLGATPAARAAAYLELMHAYVGALPTVGVDDGMPAEDGDRYGRRVERPDGVSAREGQMQWGKIPTRS